MKKSTKHQQTCIFYRPKSEIAKSESTPGPAITFCYTLGGLSSVDFCDNELGNESEHVVDAVLRLAQRGVGGI